MPTTIASTNYNMKSYAIFSLLTSTLIASAVPVAEVLPTESTFDTTLTARGDKPGHGRCKLWFELVEYLPRQNSIPGKTKKEPSKALIEVRVAANNQGWPGLTTPTWSNGEPINWMQDITSEDGPVFLNDIIEPGSEIRIDWMNATGPVTENPWDYVHINYTRHRGGTQAAVIGFTDQDTNLPWARCTRNFWNGGSVNQYRIENKKLHGRRTTCDFNC